MLSKMKAEPEAQAAPADATSSQQASEDEDADAESINQDNNNNHNNNNNNMDSGGGGGGVVGSEQKNGKSPQVERKKSREELLNIVEVSRERRLSKDSADSLGNFIRWSFGHRLGDSLRMSSQRDERMEEDEEDRNTLASDVDDYDDDEEWAAAGSRHESISALSGKLQQPSQDHPSKSKFSPSSGATNLTLAKSGSSSTTDGRSVKRARTYLMDSPPPTISTSAQPARKTSSYLGNVVERLHQQQQQQQQLESLRQRQDTIGQHEQEPSANLSQHLQRFLQQQTSLEDLCSQVGLDESNQLALAAAIHRALVDSSAGSNHHQVDSKSTASSTGSSSGASSGGSNNNNQTLNLSRIQQAALNGSSAAGLAGLVEPMNRQRRAYNTRASMHGALGSSQQQQQQQHHQPAAASGAAAVAAAAAAAAAMGPSLAASLAPQTNQSQANRAHNQQQQQQQRHAQAAAALSALASVGSQLAAAAAVASSHHHPAHHNHHQAHGQHHHRHHSHHQFVGSPGLNATTTNPMSGSLAATTLPGVDFECDTCGSSFDDRHRLMQHQSIHLELKKDWFTETPVDEVMKIFNRRRGEFLCNICNLRFEATLDYDQHNHQVHGPRPYCCQFCGNGTRTFKCWRQYLNHLYDHRYIFSCTIDDCDFTVNRRDSLRFHIFRFHLNCQLPQNQQTQPLRVNQHQPPTGTGGGDSLVGASRKWAPLAALAGLHADSDEDLVGRDNDDLLNDEINVAD